MGRHYTSMYLQPTGGAGGGLTEVDFSTGYTESNTGQLDDEASIFGTVSTLVSTATHGRLDSTLDAYVRMVSVGAPPAGAKGIHIRTRIQTPPTTNNATGVESCLVSLANQATLASNEGYVWGARLSATSVLKSSNVSRWGSGNSNGETITGVYASDAYFLFEDSKVQMGMVRGTGETTGEDVLSQATALASTFTDLYIGIGLELTATSPSGVTTWAGITVSFEWLT